MTIDIVETRKVSKRLQHAVARYHATALSTIMGDGKLRIIAMELLNALRANVTVDWHHEDNGRARMRQARLSEPAPTALARKAWSRPASCCDRARVRH